MSTAATSNEKNRDLRQKLKPYRWKNRLVVCSLLLKPEQEKIFIDPDNKVLIQELKLKLLVSPKVKGCVLIGLDGGDKLSSANAFSMQTLKKTINLMPMRQRELQNASK